MPRDSSEKQTGAETRVPFDERSVTSRPGAMLVVSMMQRPGHILPQDSLQVGHPLQTGPLEATLDKVASTDASGRSASASNNSMILRNKLNHSFNAAPDSDGVSSGANIKSVDILNGYTLLGPDDHRAQQTQQGDGRPGSDQMSGVVRRNLFNHISSGKHEGAANPPTLLSHWNSDGDAGSQGRQADDSSTVLGTRVDESEPAARLEAVRPPRLEVGKSSDFSPSAIFLDDSAPSAHAMLNSPTLDTHKLLREPFMEPINGSHTKIQSHIDAAWGGRSQRHVDALLCFSGRPPSPPLNAGNEFFTKENPSTLAPLPSPIPYPMAPGTGPFIERASFRKAVEGARATTAEARAKTVSLAFYKCEENAGESEGAATMKFLMTVPSKELATAFKLPTMHSSTTIIEVLRTLSKYSTVLIKSVAEEADDLGKIIVSDRLWSRESFLEVAMQCPDLEAPIQHVVSQVAQVPTVHHNDTLDRVWQVMIATSSREVGTVNDDGLVTGVIEFEDLYSVLMSRVDYEHAIKKTSSDDAKTSELAMRRFSVLGDGDDDLPLTAHNMKEHKSLKAAAMEKKKMGHLRKYAQEWVQSAFTELLIVILVLIDLSFTIYEQTLPEDIYSSRSNLENPLNVITGSILFMYCYELFVRVYGYRWSLINFSRVLDTIDACIVVASVIVYILAVTATTDNVLQKIIPIARILRFMRLVKIASRLRKVIGANRSRYQQDGFDLDLTYVTPTCIAMSLPSVGAEANYRNPIDDVRRFFHVKHPEHYLIFNLCAERVYDHKLFDDRVVRIEVDDHNPPTIRQLIAFVERVAAHMEQDPSNVVAIHCKGGKGRTGVAVCTWLLYSTFSDSAEDAMEFFAKKRTGKKAKAKQGVTGASQRRYVAYMEDVFKAGGVQEPRLVLKRIVMHTCPAMDPDGGCDPWLTIEEIDGRGEVFDWRDRQPTFVNMPKTQPFFEFNDINVPLQADVRFTFYDHDFMPPREELMCYFWIHTGFVNGYYLELKKPEIDVAWSDRKCKIFKEGFRFELFFGPADVSPVAGPYVNSSPRNLQTLHAYAVDAANASEDVFFRKVEPPSFRIIERALRNRGREQGTLVLDQEYKMPTPTEAEGGVVLSGPIEGSLYVARGPTVTHDNVRLITLSAEEMNAAHDGTKQLVHSYRRNSMISRFSGVSLLTRAKSSRGLTNRFEQDGFDLDLTYITPRLIVLAAPIPMSMSTHTGANIFRFLCERHAGHFRIINLQVEKGLDKERYHNRVADYSFPTGQPPPLSIILPCVANAHRFLQESPNHVVLFHCKDGRTRSGCLSACYMLYGGLRVTATSALNYFHAKRSSDGKTILLTASQMRYVRYFQEILTDIRLRSLGGTKSVVSGVEPRDVIVPMNCGKKVLLSVSLSCDNTESPKPHPSLSPTRTVSHMLPFLERTPPSVSLIRITFNTIPHFDRDGGCDPWFQVRVRDSESLEAVLQYDSKKYKSPKHIHPREKSWTTDFDGFQEGLRVSGDVELRFFDEDLLSEPEYMCSLWFNTHFLKDPPPELCGRVQRLTVHDCQDQGLPVGSFAVTFFKSEIDSAAADTKHAKFDSDFYIKVICVECMHMQKKPSDNLKYLNSNQPVKENCSGRRLSIIGRRNSWLGGVDDSVKKAAEPIGLQKDREAYEVHLAECSVSNETPCPYFTDFLLNPSTHVKMHLTTAFSSGVSPHAAGSHGSHTARRGSHSTPTALNHYKRALGAQQGVQHMHQHRRHSAESIKLDDKQQVDLAIEYAKSRRRSSIASLDFDASSAQGKILERTNIAILDQQIAYSNLRRRSSAGYASIDLLQPLGDQARRRSTISHTSQHSPVYSPASRNSVVA